MSTEGPHYGITALSHNDAENWAALQRTRREQLVARVVLILAIGCAFCFTL